MAKEGQVSDLGSGESIAAASRYTLVPNRDAQEYVDHVLETATREILHRLGGADCTAILLTGSFGRGEGGVRRRGDGWAIVNDIEISVVQERPTPWLVDGVGRELAERFGVYKIDVGARSRSNLKPRAATMVAYDERYGSQVLYGSQGIVEEMGELDARDIHAWEGARLLLNRGGGLVMHFTWPRYLARTELASDVRQHMKNQLVKAGVALGDALIVCKGRYDTSYRARWDIFRSLVTEQGVQLSSDQAAFITQSYEEKLFPGTCILFDDLFACYERLLRAYIQLFLQVMSQHFGAPMPDMNAYVRMMAGTSKRNASIGLTRARRAMRAARRAVLDPRLPRGEDWRNQRPRLKEIAYAAIPLVLESAPFLSSPEYEYLQLAGKLLAVWAGGRFVRIEDRWERIREACFERWYATCH
jgi:hypothetical protein